MDKDSARPSKQSNYNSNDNMKAGTTSANNKSGTKTSKVSDSTNKQTYGTSDCSNCK